MADEGKDQGDFSDFSGEEEDNGSSSSQSELSGSSEDEDEEDEEDAFDDRAQARKGKLQGDSDFDASFAGESDKKEAAPRLQVREVENQPYDAKVDLEESFSDESIDTHDDAQHNPKMRAVDQPRTSPQERERGDSPPRQALSPGVGDLSEAEEIPGSIGSEGKQAGGARAGANMDSGDDNDDDEDEDEEDEAPRKKSTAGVKLEAQSAYMQDAARQAGERAKEAARNERLEREATNAAANGDDDDDDESSASSSAAGRDRASAVPVGGYDPSDYEYLEVSSEVKELFQYIGRYKPHDLELDTTLKCFVPDFIPAVGQIDTFVKIPPPTMEPDHLGLTVLDEPSANQSDATVLDLQLRAISKKSVKNPMVVRSIENANRDKKAVQGWIDSIKELHRSKPMPTVHYTRQMPDIESLMQVWPEEVEALLRQVQLPGADIDLDLKDYARVVCATLDIPVFTSMVESLHVLFTLYMEFKSNQHFQRAQMDPSNVALPQDDGF